MLDTVGLRRRFPGELLLNLVLRDIRSRFKRSTLGWLWSLINPLSSLLIYSVVFGVVFSVAAPVGARSGLESFPMFLVCALLPWNFLANGLNGTAASIVVNEGLVKKVHFPRWVLPASSVIAGLAGFGVELLVLAGVLLVFGNVVLTALPMLLVVVAIQVVFVFGVGLVLSAGNAYFRDVGHFLAIVLNLWFYATPIVYPPDQPPERQDLLGVSVPLQRILEANPMSRFVEAYRDLLYDLQGPTLANLLWLCGWALAALVVGVAVFRRLSPRLAEEL